MSQLWKSVGYLYPTILLTGICQGDNSLAIRVIVRARGGVSSNAVNTFRVVI
jgi:hypothetical protein